MTKSINYTITYVLLPQAAGNVTVGAAEVTVDGTVYRSNALPIEIVNEGKSPGAGGTQSPAARGLLAGRYRRRTRSPRTTFCCAPSVSRTSVYKGEPLRVTSSCTSGCRSWDTTT